MENPINPISPIMQQPVQEKKTNMLIWVVVIIIFILIAGALWMFSRNAPSNEPSAQNIPQPIQNTNTNTNSNAVDSTGIASIEDDLNTMDVSSLTGDLSSMQAEVNALK